MTNNHQDLKTTIEQLKNGQLNQQHTKTTIEQKGKCTQIGGDFWYPEHATHPTQTRHAIAICNECPVEQLCLATAIATNEPHGIWGGLTPKTRTTLKNRLFKPTQNKTNAEQTQEKQTTQPEHKNNQHDPDQQQPDETDENNTTPLGDEHQEPPANT